jgi:D-serine deaminase-like pyridoxal phosphate-dependent protein
LQDRDGVGVPISALSTPALILDRATLVRNLERMRGRLAQFAVPLRPHLKTAKSAEIWRMSVDGQPGGIAVQTLAEAEYFAARGCTDILYVVSAVGSKLARLARLQHAGAKVTIICDSFDAAASIQAASVRLGTSFPVLIEIDADGTRGGIPLEDPNLVPLARELARGPGTSLEGVLCHAGSVYGATSLQDIVLTAEIERVAAVTAAKHIRAVGLPCATVSVGSSPSATLGQSFEGVTEVRAGVYMFNDLSLVEFGLCERADIAMTVLSTVIAHNRAAGKIIIDAGALALSKDLGFTDRTQPHYGELVHASSRQALGLQVDAMSQEHGMINAGPVDFDRLPIGSLVQILPNHACITAAGFTEYAVIDRDTVTEVWDRCAGW